MSTLTELVHYCNEKEPAGALMLTGEWGCGKTHLIEKDLTKALKDTHVIVRVSLFGVNNVSVLHDAVKQKWFEECLPFLEILQKVKDRGFLNAVNAVVKKLSPVAGNAAAMIGSVNVTDLIPVKPEIESIKTHSKKRVILVFDDLERTKMDMAELLGIINDYCENQKFNSIISANEEIIRSMMEKDATAYHMMREKTISQVLYHIPDYAAIVHSIISKTEWQTPEYAEYLSAREELIRDVFMTDSEEPERVYQTKKDRKYHNFRALKKGLQSFYRLFYHLNEGGIEYPDRCFYSFLAYYLISKSGCSKDGKPTIAFDDNDIKEFYPKYSPEDVTEPVRSWINTGIWDKESILKDLEIYK